MQRQSAISQAAPRKSSDSVEDSGRILLSIIVPVFNEADILGLMAEGLAPAADDIVGAGRWEFVLVDNGSTDGSAEAIAAIVKRWPTCQAVHLTKPDYGEALATGLDHARGEWAYIINVEWRERPFLEWSWEHRADYDLILGSKRADPALHQARRYRRLLSWGLNAILQLFFGFCGTDTHGQKVLRLKTMRPILQQTRLRRGQFDTEFVLRALRAGLWLAEVPVPVYELRPARNLMLNKILRNVVDISRLRRLIHQVPYAGPIRYHRWARSDVLATTAHPELGAHMIADGPATPGKAQPARQTPSALAMAVAAADASAASLRGFYEAKYAQREEVMRTSKAYTVRVLPNSRPLAVLDIGCGTGLNSSAIAALGHRVYGLDIAEPALRTYRDRGFAGVVGDLEAGLPYRSGTLEAVFMSEVVEHLLDPERVLKEVFRVLQPGGVLVLSTPNSAFWVYRVLGMCGVPVSELQHPKHIHFFSRRSLRRILESAGFQVENERGRNMYLLVPDFGATISRLLESLGFTREERFRTGRAFYHLSHETGVGNRFFADTLILRARRPSVDVTRERTVRA